MSMELQLSNGSHWWFSSIFSRTSSSFRSSSRVSYGPFKVFGPIEELYGNSWVFIHLMKLLKPCLLLPFDRFTFKILLELSNHLTRQTNFSSLLQQNWNAPSRYFTRQSSLFINIIFNYFNAKRTFILENERFIRQNNNVSFQNKPIHIFLQLFNGEYRRSNSDCSNHCT